jgi:hypothetical protein
VSAALATTPDDVDRGLARLATRQSGVVGRAQLRRLGLSADSIDRRIARGALIAIHRGVYAVGHAALSDRARVVAGLLAAGPTAVASHWTAAALYALVRAVPPVVEVTVPGRPRRSRPGLTIHSSTRPPRGRTRDGIPVTTPARTLADLIATRPRDEVERVAVEAIVKRLVTQNQVDAILGAPLAPTRSKLEREMLKLLAAAGLPRPEVGRRIGAYVVDFAWPEQRVVVETDGYAFHGHRVAFERDRARDAALHAAGYAVLRFT